MGSPSGSFAVRSWSCASTTAAKTSKSTSTPHGKACRTIRCRCRETRLLGRYGFRGPCPPATENDLFRDPLLGLLSTLPGHLVKDFIDGLPPEYRVGHVPVGLHVEKGLAQHVTFDGRIIRTVAGHGAVELFFEARPSSLHECTGDPGIVFRPHGLWSRYLGQILDQRQQADRQGIGRRIHERVEKPGDLFLLRPPLLPQVLDAAKSIAGEVTNQS